MLFTGITRTFSTENEQQYETIGAFWAEMENKYDCTRLRGLGYNWTPGTIEYVIGLTDGYAEGSDCTVILPDEGWTEVRGRTENLGHIYDGIYKDGALSYEIETFDPDGNCRILYSRSPEGYKKICRATEKDLDERYPVVYGSTGSWTLLLPVKHLDAFRKMKPDNRRFPEILTQYPRSSVHPFCLETIHPEASMHGRHFSSPFSGTVEDPVTGTASGVMGMYYRKYIEKNAPGGKRSEILVEQGQEIGRDGIVRVCLPERPLDAVRIYGTAVFVKEFEVEF